MGSEHLSSYEVIYEEDTALFAQLQAGEFEVDEDLACAMYEELVARAADAGYQQYEIANFARDTTQQSTPDPPDPLWPAAIISTIGAAVRFTAWVLSATSYVRGARMKNWSNTQLYCEQLEKGQRAIESREELPPLALRAKCPRLGFAWLQAGPSSNSAKPRATICKRNGERK